MARNIKRVKGEGFVSFEIGKEVLTVAVADVEKGLISKLLVHGLNAKVGDSAASCKTDSERVSAIKQSIENLKKGVWNEVNSGGTILAEALAKVKAITTLEAQALLDGLDDEQMDAVKGHPKVKNAIAEIRQARLASAAKGAKLEDLDAVLGL